MAARSPGIIAPGGGRAIAPGGGRATAPSGAHDSVQWPAPRTILAGLLLGLLLFTSPLAAQQTGSVTGRIIGNPAKGSLKGATVVLMWFRTDTQGKPEAGPIARQVAGKNGGFAFRDVPIDRKARYQLGTRVDGRLVGSDPFTFAAGERDKQVNLTIPEVVADRSALSISQALYVVEPRVGKVWITEVLHLRNQGRNIISTLDTPLELPLPSEAQDLEMIRMEARQGKHERIGGKLLVLGRFPPGNNTIAFRYSLPALLGGFSMEKSYALPAEEVLIISEQGGVEVSGTFLQRREPREIEKKIYDTWGAANVPAGAEIHFSVSGMPVAQWIYLMPTALFFVLMAGVVLWFLRRRLA